MTLDDVKNDQPGIDYYIPLTKKEFDVLRSYLFDFVEKCSCSHCQEVLDDVLAELNYQHSEWYPHDEK